MSTFFDKKKILEDNKDLYISDHDKSLDSNSLMGIIEAKRSYESAKNAGNVLGMKNANKKANNIRMSAANYDGGSDGSEFNKSYYSYETKRPKSYSSDYDTERKRIMNMISDYEDFSYNPESDPVFQSYRALYSKLGNEAYDRALANGYLRTGGASNSSAQSLAMQAKNTYNTRLMEIAEKLYESAYDKYSDEYERLYKLLDAVDNADNTDYERYRDTVEDFKDEKDHLYKRENDFANLLADRYEFETDSEANRYEFDSKAESDRYEFDANMNYKREKDSADNAYRNSKLAADIHSDNVSAAINLAKALYGKTPISRYSVNSILDILK